MQLQVIIGGAGAKDQIPITLTFTIARFGSFFGDFLHFRLLIRFSLVAADVLSQHTITRLSLFYGIGLRWRTNSAATGSYFHSSLIHFHHLSHFSCWKRITCVLHSCFWCYYGRCHLWINQRIFYPMSYVLVVSTLWKRWKDRKCVKDPISDFWIVSYHLKVWKYLQTLLQMDF